MQILILKSFYSPMEFCTVHEEQWQFCDLWNMKVFFFPIRTHVAHRKSSTSYRCWKGLSYVTISILFFFFFFLDFIWFSRKVKCLQEVEKGNKKKKWRTPPHLYTTHIQDLEKGCYSFYEPHGFLWMVSSLTEEIIKTKYKNNVI